MIEFVIGIAFIAGVATVTVFGLLSFVFRENLKSAFSRE